MIRAVLCDDEALAVERMLAMVGHFADIAIAGEASDGRAALDLIARERPHLVFIDIEMPGLDGFDVVEELARSASQAGGYSPLIVFVTAYPRFAAEAFETGALDFLTKPVRFARLERSVERARRALADRDSARRLAELVSQLDMLRSERDDTFREGRHLWVQRRGEVVRVDLDRLDWVQAEGEYVRLFCAGSSYLHRDAISALLDRLDRARFVRVHRSLIVNRERVAAVRRSRHGGLRLVLATGEELPVGRTYRTVVRGTIIGRPGLQDCKAENEE